MYQFKFQLFLKINQEEKESEYEVKFYVIYK